MHRESAPAALPPVSLPTGLALAGVVALLGALALFLIGCDRLAGLQRVERAFNNTYQCRVECSKGDFGPGASVETTADTTVHTSPGGALRTGCSPDPCVEPQGSAGTLLRSNPIPGGTAIWWEVVFADGVQGWVPEAKLIVTGGTEVVLDKTLDVCMPPEWNRNIGGMEPSSLDAFSEHCQGPVAEVFREHHAAELPPGAFCKFEALNVKEFDGGSCNQPCADGAAACTRMGFDPDPPVPDSLAVSVFQPVSICTVTGEVELHMDDKLFRTPAQGVVQVRGRPCQPGEPCRIGVAYDLALDDITIPVRFASDPTFTALRVTGSSEPDAVELGQFIGSLYAGRIPVNASFSSLQGRRAAIDVDEPVRTINGRNDVDTDQTHIAVAVDWGNKRCLIDGIATVDVEDDDGNTFPMTLVVTAGGLFPELSLMVNQPPGPDLGSTLQTVECTSPQGAMVTLDASRSSDPDSNLSFYVWRTGSETGPQVAPPSTNPVVTTQQAVGATTYHARVVDSWFAAASAPVTVTVEDTTAPVIACNAPAEMEPPGSPVSFTATATDTCSGVSGVTISRAECFHVRRDGQLQPKTCNLRIAGDTLTIRDTGGVNTLIRWYPSAVDGAAGSNTSQTTCEVFVRRP